MPLSKREAKIKNQADFFAFDKFTLQNLANWWRVKQPSEVNSTTRRFFLSYTADLGENAVFHNFEK